MEPRAALGARGLVGARLGGRLADRYGTAATAPGVMLAASAGVASAESGWTGTLALAHSLSTRNTAQATYRG